MSNVIRFIGKALKWMGIIIIGYLGINTLVGYILLATGIVQIV